MGFPAKSIHTMKLETLADNVNALYNNLLKTIHNLEQEIYKVEEMEVQKTNLLRSASHELKNACYGYQCHVGKYDFKRREIQRPYDLSAKMQNAHRTTCSDD